MLSDDSHHPSDEFTRWLEVKIDELLNKELSEPPEQKYVQYLPSTQMFADQYYLFLHQN